MSMAEICQVVSPVALRKESVDRNNPCSAAVALRKESVDRNGIASVACITVICVALRKESVDRNISQPMRGKTDEGRSPQGEHGMFLFLTVQGGFVHADIRFNLKNCYSKKLSHKII